MHSTRMSSRGYWLDHTAMNAIIPIAPSACAGVALAPKVGRGMIRERGEGGVETNVPNPSTGGPAMQRPRVRFTPRWVVAAVILVTVTALFAAIERRERLRREMALVKADTAYRDARLAREHAEVAAKEYAEGTYARELAAAEDEIKKAEDELNRIKPAAAAYQESVERIRSKGYLFLIRNPNGGNFAVTRATFAIEQAKSKKVVLEGYTKIKTLNELNDQIAKARMDELAKKAAYDGVKATPVGFIGKVIRGK